MVLGVEFTPPGGVFQAASVAIAMTTPTWPAAIRYTTDGSDPTASTTLYTAPLTLDAVSTTTVKARAFTTCGSSGVASDLRGQRRCAGHGVLLPQ